MTSTNQDSKCPDVNCQVCSAMVAALHISDDMPTTPPALMERECTVDCKRCLQFKLTGDLARCPTHYKRQSNTINRPFPLNYTTVCGNFQSTLCPFHAEEFDIFANCDAPADSDSDSDW